MLAVLIALILLAVAVGAIYLILKSMGEEGVEIASPGSCKSGRCGVRCSHRNDAPGNQEEPLLDESGEHKRKDIA